MFTNGCSFKEALFKGAISGTAVGLDFLKVPMWLKSRFNVYFIISFKTNPHKPTPLLSIFSSKLQ